jgi:hypothetical protein
MTRAHSTSRTRRGSDSGQTHDRGQVRDSARQPSDLNYLRGLMRAYCDFDQASPADEDLLAGALL